MTPQEILAEARRVTQDVKHDARKPVWDNPDNDPNKRKSVGEDPTGESNRIA